MTVEEKAKAYDIVIQRVTELYETGTTLTKEQMEHLFPELRESEDERIIRAIIDALYSHTNSINLLSSRGYQMGNIEAWLEKHKYDRMKPVYDNQDSFESALGKAWKDYNDSGAITVDGCEDNYVECAHAKGFREGYLFGLEKQKEYHIPWYDYQKSKEAGYTIVPNEEYEQLIKQKEQNPIQSNIEKEYIRTIKSLIADFLRGKCDIDAGYYQKIYDWLDGRHIEPNPAEWSEEDEKMLNQILGDLEWARLKAIHIEDKNRIPYEKKSAWLKSLHPQPQREWSEKDENIINNICDYLLGVLRLSDAAKEKAIVFLNSLRPPKGWKEGWCEDCKVRYNHWKPSEEQMKALNAMNCYGELSYQGQQQLLIDLYQQLKKL